jgi:class 3 adenylate cyclase/tetratricopeptide (TPR) repeat protein
MRERSCARCGTSNAHDSRFCRACGHSLEQRDDGERRQLTVLFCDLVGSTELSSRIDPEELREVVRHYQRLVGDFVKREAGHVAHYLGDGIVAYFGYPEAGDDDAARAVRAALAIVDAIPRSTVRFQGVDAARSEAVQVAVRIGVHTGTVVIGDVGGDEHVEVMALGETPNLAARLQALAEPNAIVISAATHRLVAGLFVVEQIAPQHVKGIAEPVRPYRVLRASGARSRLEAAAVHGLTPFVGRAREQGLLDDLWHRTLAGEGQLALVSGEPGIGKSRLVQHFRERLAATATPPQWLECRGARVFRNTPFHPLVELLEDQLAATTRDDPAALVARLEASLDASGLDVAEVVPLITPVLGLPVPERYAPSLTPSAHQRRRLLVVLTQWIAALARDRPLVVVMEDLQWIDPSTLELEGALARRAASARILLLCTARNEFSPPWMHEPHHTHVALDRLPHADALAIIRCVIEHTAGDGGHETDAATRGIAPAIAEAMATRSDGVPLFAEELTRCVLERGTASAAQALYDIPSTLQDSLMSRLDRLGAAKEVAQIGAVIGREFSYALLRAVSPLGESDLQAALDRLADAELVFRDGLPPRSTYVFKHALVQDTAYASLLRSRRRELHATIASTLRERFPQLAELQPEVLAHHYTEAGDIAPAVAAWRQAGLNAVTRSAHREAVAHLERGLAVLGRSPEDASRAQDEIVLQIFRGSSLQATAGYGSHPATQAFERARELGDRFGSSFPLIFVLLGHWASLTNRGEILAGMEVAEQIYRQAERDGSPGTLMWGHFARGVTALYRGDPRRARATLERAVDIYDEKDHRLVPSDPGVNALGFLSLALWHLGFPDQADARLRAAIGLATRLEKPYEQAWVHVFGGSLSVSMRDPVRARRHAESLVRLSREGQFPVLVAIGTMVSGWSLAVTGDPALGTARLHEGLAAYLATEQRIAHGFYLALLAEAYALGGNGVEAVRIVEDLLSADADEELHKADHLRLRGDLAARFTRDPAAAEESYRAAIAFARGQGTRSYELRAATHYARLLHAMGRMREAAEIVGAQVAGFTEGYNTPDVRNATRLLAELR